MQKILIGRKETGFKTITQKKKQLFDIIFQEITLTSSFEEKSRTNQMFESAKFQVSSHRTQNYDIVLNMHRHKKYEYQDY